MLGARLARAILFVLGVVYPGYLTYKTLEHDRKRPDACRGWCCYWVVYAAWATCERGLDRAFDGRVGLYRESKVAFVTYLWHPRFQGALYVYDRFLAPFLAKHERGVDDVLATMFERVGDVAGRAFRSAYAYARRSVNDALSKATEAQMAAQFGGGASASGRADRVDLVRRRAVAHASTT
ncbi:TB2/DP1/HVA22-related protein [Ostreococcus tauri]|uniref:HVA22-like protein n=1 Tax=Ostreococcus tauri TaxID=70448 RepID=A0A090MAK2_OSTTA|nr:TB2/DP1/HVA22-related protein [Ostreococcus tauri]OUS48821.1 TB2/DP1, HVA22 family-domain-containing protein [Ostreococcus tauri]CEF99139.1 TB2/DP1/HVA22-related protein [Ostreococcus tauri]|eukprot:XP_022839665.1 TB2/DP1/HVA22-related protein [Ostreococcus tauri]